MSASLRRVKREEAVEFFVQRRKAQRRERKTSPKTGKTLLKMRGKTLGAGGEPEGAREKVAGAVGKPAWAGK